ncbi:MAG TPA: hypothetical protein VF271_02940 [Rhodanobacteraceae bacterium]
MKHPQASTLEGRARDLYLRAGPRVDAAMAGRLRAARRNALQPSATHRHHPRWMMPAGAVAAALLVAVGVWQPLQHGTHVPAPVAVNAAASNEEVLPPDADQTDPTLYQNLDFYAWLAQQPTARTSHGH